MNKHRMIPVLMSGVSDTVSPTVAITSTATNPTAAATVPLTITFSEDVTGFLVGDITVVNCTLGALTAVSAKVYTVTATPTVPGTVTADIAAGVAVDGAGNGNTAATQFSIFSYVGAVAWIDFSDIATLWKDAARTSAVTADGDSILGVTDKSAAGNHLTTPSALASPLYKTNIQNSKSSALYNNAASQYFSFASAIINGASYSCVIVHKADEEVNVNNAALLGMSGSSVGAVTINSATNITFGGNDIAITSATYLNTPKITKLRANFTDKDIFAENNSNALASNTNALTYNYIIQFIGARRESGPFYSGYMFEIILFSSVLSDAVMTALTNQLNTKWTVF